MGNYKVDPNAYKAAMESVRKNNVFESKWIKMEEGSHQLRFAPPVDANPNPFTKISQHQFFKTPEGKTESPICLGFISSDKQLIEATLDSQALTAQDFDLIKKNGCPMCRIAAALYNLAGSNKDKKDQAKKFLPSNKVIWNVVNRVDDKNYMWSSRPSFADEMLLQAGQYPDLFDAEDGNDVIVAVTGKGNQKRYGAPVVVRESLPMGDVTLYNHITDGIIPGVYSYAHLMGLIKFGYSDVLAELAKK